MTLQDLQALFGDLLSVTLLSQPKDRKQNKTFHRVEEILLPRQNLLSLIAVVKLKTSSLVAYCCYLLTYLFYVRSLVLHGVACCCNLLTYLFYFCGTLECNNVTTCSTGACSHQAQPSCRIHATLSSLLSRLYPIYNLV